MSPSPSSPLWPHCPFSLCPRILAPCPKQMQLPWSLSGKNINGYFSFFKIENPLHICCLLLKLNIWDSPVFQAMPRYFLSPIIVLPSPGGNFPLMNQLLIPFPIHSFISIPLPVNSLSRSWRLFHFFTLIFAYKIASFKNRLWSFFLLSTL